MASRFEGFIMGSLGRQIPGFIAGLLAGGAVVALAFLFLFPKQEPAVVVPGAAPAGPSASEPETADLPPLPPTKDPGAGKIPGSSAAPAEEGPSGREAGDTEIEPPPESSFTILRGRVVFGDHREPLPGILVKFSHEGNYYGECITGESGAFSQGLSRPGEWRVEAFPFGTDGFRPSAKVIGGASGELFQELRVPSRLDFQVSGRVTDGEERGIDGVEVTLNCYTFHSSGPPARMPTRKTTTAGGGHYVLPGVSLDLPKPKPRNPQSVEDRRFGWSRSGNMQSRQHVNLSFRHPDYGSRS
ncbi:MAG: carboxypeptidase-like regulatory domain-containing protein, partial [Planctomycetota bacterium]